MMTPICVIAGLVIVGEIEALGRHPPWRGRLSSHSASLACHCGSAANFPVRNAAAVRFIDVGLAVPVRQKEDLSPAVNA
jgi:hypothetical protein